MPGGGNETLETDNRGHRAHAEVKEITILLGKSQKRKWHTGFEFQFDGKRTWRIRLQAVGSLRGCVKVQDTRWGQAPAKEEQVDMCPAGDLGAVALELMSKSIRKDRWSHSMAEKQKQVCTYWLVGAFFPPFVSKFNILAYSHISSWLFSGFFQGWSILISTNKDVIFWSLLLYVICFNTQSITNNTVVFC